MIFCHPVDENPPVLCSAQLHLEYCEGGENWLMFEVGEGNVKDWVFRMEKVPGSWVMVGHSRHWWRAGKERLGDFYQLQTEKRQKPPWNRAIQRLARLRTLREINICHYFDRDWPDWMCIEVRWQESVSDSVTEWWEYEVVRLIWYEKDLSQVSSHSWQDTQRSTHKRSQ